MKMHIGNYQDAKNETGDYTPIDPNQERVALGIRRPTGKQMNTSAIPWEVFRLDGKPVSEDDFKNGYFPDYGIPKVWSSPNEEQE